MRGFITSLILLTVCGCAATHGVWHDVLLPEARTIQPRGPRASGRSTSHAVLPLESASASSLFAAGTYARSASASAEVRSMRSASANAWKGVSPDHADLPVMASTRSISRPWLRWTATRITSPRAHTCVGVPVSPSSRSTSNTHFTRPPS